MCGRVYAALRLCSADVALAWCCLWVVSSVPAMTARKDICLLCTKELYAKQKFPRCCGPCVYSFHLSCPQFSEKEYAYYTDTAAFTHNCAACVKTVRSRRNDVTPVKSRSTSTSDLPKKIISPERALVLSPVFGSDKCVALSVYLEILRLSGVCTIDFIKRNLLDTVHKLSEDVASLQSGNVSLISQITSGTIAPRSRSTGIQGNYWHI
jgi:hypothetical protein